ncbi:MAG: tRNA 4-thiouridine(8) synthase ThiI, partial [Clostridia bacterium]|nr:tRNA 4-thiouridine(8) synthase ThiI [Clostridia bacterium]
MEQVILVRMGEMYLKGRNRPFFERQLRRALAGAVAPFNGVLERGEGRYYVAGIAGADMEAALAAAAKVFGVHSVSPAAVCDKDLDVIAEVAALMLPAGAGASGEGGARQPLPTTFRVTARRSDKNFPYKSDQIAALVGEKLLERCPGMTVDLHDYEFNIQVEIRERAYVHIRTVPGMGGMPPHTNGRAMLLLSGGIDSPVAGFLTARRGVCVDAVYFHSFPYTSDHAQEKVLSLARQVAAYTGNIRVFVVGFTDIQLKIRDNCPESLATVIGRRFMMRIACALAEQNECMAVVTGESIGQVASQTMEGLFCSDAAADRPVLRPLVAMDKLEIMDKAKQIGTYDISILPYEDCCSVFSPPNPSTHPSLKKVLQAETALPAEELIAAALEKTVYYQIYSNET